METTVQKIQNVDDSDSDISNECKTAEVIGSISTGHKKPGKSTEKIVRQCKRRSASKRK